MTNFFRRSIVAPTDSFQTAMRAIDESTCEIALAVDEHGRLVGTLTDGDIRRALLAGRSLDDPIEGWLATHPVTVTQTDSRAEVLDLMRARRVSQIPVLDDAGRVVGLHLMGSLVTLDPIPNLAVIMAGGRGARLAGLTESTPKPMLRVAGRPILERLVLHLVGAGVTRIAISVNYLGEVIEAHFGDGSAFGCQIEYLREDPDRPLGTAGSLSLVAPVLGEPTEPVLVMNGDLVTQFAVRDLLQTHEAGDTVATIAVREYTHQVPFGVVCGSDDGYVASMVEKPVQSWLINAGIYVLEPSLIATVPADQQCTLPGLIESARQGGARVGLWRLFDEWIDVGRRHELDRARGPEL